MIDYLASGELVNIYIKDGVLHQGNSKYGILNIQQYKHYSLEKNGTVTFNQCCIKGMPKASFISEKISEKWLLFNEQYLVAMIDETQHKVGLYNTQIYGYSSMCSGYVQILIYEFESPMRFLKVYYHDTTFILLTDVGTVYTLQKRLILSNIWSKLDITNIVDLVYSGNTYFMIDNKGSVYNSELEEIYSYARAIACCKEFLVVLHDIRVMRTLLSTIGVYNFTQIGRNLPLMKNIAIHTLATISMDEQNNLWIIYNDTGRTLLTNIKVKYLSTNCILVPEYDLDSLLIKSARKI